MEDISGIQLNTANFWKGKLHWNFVRKHTPAGWAKTTYSGSEKNF